MVASYDCATLKVTELFSKAILLPMFVYGDCIAVCSIYIRYLSATAESTIMKGCPHIFIYSVYIYIVPCLSRRIATPFCLCTDVCLFDCLTEGIAGLFVCVFECVLCI